MTKRTITLGEFIDNIEKNGFPQISGFLYAFDNKNEPNIELGACALGQGLYNTFGGYSANDKFITWLYKFTDPHSHSLRYRHFVNFITHKNDNERLSIAEIAKAARETFSDHLSEAFEFDTDEPTIRY